MILQITNHNNKFKYRLLANLMDGKMQGIIIPLQIKTYGAYALSEQKCYRDLLFKFIYF